MKRVFAFWVDWLVFGSLLGYWFVLKYKLGIAREGVDFITRHDKDVYSVQAKKKSFIVDWLEFGSSVGYWFALKYKLRLAKEGVDFVSHWNVNLTQSY